MTTATAMRHDPDPAVNRAALARNGPDPAMNQAGAMRNGPDSAMNQASAMRNGPDPAINQATAMQHDPSEGWQARIELEFRAVGPRTVLVRNEHHGPLVVQKPFYPEDEGPAHVYLVHPPGGVCGGDNLSVALDLGDRAHALATTPAAGKFYRSAGQPARLDQHFRVGAGAGLEWLPQETIVYDGAVAAMTTRVELAPTAGYLGWEIVCLGLTASNKPFTRGVFSQRLEIRRDNRPLFIENLRCQGGDPGLTAPWGLSGHSVAATFACTLAAPEPSGAASPALGAALPVARGAALPASKEAALSAARDAVAPFTENNLVAVSACDDLIVCRLLGRDSATAKKTFIAVWRALRPLTLGRPAHPPRIWAT